MTDQTSEDPTQTGELGPMPTPQAQPSAPNPGGPDAVPDADEVISADLDPEKNAAVDNSPGPVKQSLQAAEDTTTEATRSDASEDADGSATASQESPA